MARRKQVNPMQRIPSGEVMKELPESPETWDPRMNGSAHKISAKEDDLSTTSEPSSQKRGGTFQLVVCIAGVYASFLTWAVLQERLTTTPYPTVPSSFISKPHSQEYFRFPVVLNTVQAFFAFLTGSIYLFATTPLPAAGPLSLILPKNAIIAPLLLVSITQSLASPFGYMSLNYVDYLTYVLAKSCKLLPVMFLHITLFQRRYPLSKYLIVLAVTAGVAVFTLSHPYSPSKTKQTKKSAESNSLYGLLLLGINLLFDGLTNTIQDHIFTTPARYGPYTGQKMMVVQNALSTLVMATYLTLAPSIPPRYLPNIAHASVSELSAALTFLHHHPSILYDMLGFAACGAVGQLFIFATLERFDSLVLVTVTVTRKMLTMVLSVVWFGKRLTPMQWAGVGLVFGGVGTEGYIERQKKEKQRKMRKKGKEKWSIWGKKVL